MVASLASTVGLRTTFTDLLETAALSTSTVTAVRALPSVPFPLRVAAPKEAAPLIRTLPHPHGNSTPTKSHLSLRAASADYLKVTVKVVVALAPAVEAETVNKSTLRVGTSTPESLSSA